MILQSGITSFTTASGSSMCQGCRVQGSNWMTRVVYNQRNDTCSVNSTTPTWRLTRLWFTEVGRNFHFHDSSALIQLILGVSTTFHALAIIVTVFRIYHRHQKRQLWWDDFWAVISLFSDLIMSLTPWLRNGAYGRRSLLRNLSYAYWNLSCRYAWTSKQANCRLLAHRDIAPIGNVVS